jgi:hypothetical protein
VGCVLGIEPNEHQIPRFQGFFRQIIGFTRQIMGYSRQFMGINCANHGVFTMFHGVVSAIHGVVSSIHRHHLPKPWGAHDVSWGGFGDS